PSTPVGHGPVPDPVTIGQRLGGELGSGRPGRIRLHVVAGGHMQGTGPILIVDDEDDLRNLLRINLEREGFKAVTAATGAEALDAAQRVQPSLIVLDLMLPDTTGTEVCRRLRAVPELADVPIIML